jgi:hypothetical protein
MKYYFEKGDMDGLCYMKDYFMDLMEERGITEIEVYPARPTYGTGYFYCQEHGDMGESGEGCGIFCDFYKPRNGKNGRCRHHSTPYEPMDKSIIIKLKR